MVKVPAKDEVEYLKEGDDVVKKTTTYAVNAIPGALTSNREKGNLQTKWSQIYKVVVTPIQPECIVMRKTPRRLKEEQKSQYPVLQGTNTVTTTYTVNPTDGNLIPHEGKPVIKPSTPTVVKVPAKDEVEYLQRR